jgi:hypothetical protein
MAVFSKRIVTAYYISNDYDTIFVKWLDDNGKEHVFYLPADDTENPDYIDLVEEGWTQDKLFDSTAEYKKQTKREFATFINAQAKELIVQQNMKVEKKIKLMGLDKYQAIMDNNTKKEEIFKVKLWALELPFIQDSDSKLKRDIRKSKTILSVLGIIQKIIDEDDKDGSV